MKNVKLTLLDSNVICRGKWYGSNGFFSRDGRVMFTAGTNWDRACYYSTDGGKTWEVRENYMGRFHYIELQDGSVFGVSYENEIHGKVAREQLYKPYIMGIRRAESYDALLEGKFEDDFAYTCIPELSGACGDSANYFNGEADHGLVELPNGDIVVTMYGHFRDDKVPVTCFAADTYQYRSWVVVSRDGGYSFEYLSTMADVQTWPVGPTSEGYCEPDLKTLADGRLLGVMRSGGAATDKDWAFTPAFSVTSFDGGMTWSKPARMRGYGVYPQVVQTQNGAVVATAGRDGVYLVCSDDNGASWQEDQAVIVTDNAGKWGYSPSGYSSLGEVAPNEILLVYDDLDEEKTIPVPGSEEAKDYKPGTCHKIVANRYRVEME